MAKTPDKKPIVPEQKQFSPEQEAEFEQYVLKRQKELRRKNLLQRALVAIIAIGLPIGVAGYFWSKNTKDDTENVVTDKTKLQTKVTTLEKLLKDNDIDGLIGYSTELAEPLNSTDVPVQADALAKRIRISERLIESNRDPKSFSYGVKAKLNSLMAMSVIDARSGMDQSQLATQLKEFSSSFVDDENDEFAELALLGLAVSSVHKLITTGTDDSFQSAKSHLSILGDNVTERSIRNVAMLPALIRNSDNQKWADQLIGQLIDKLQQSKRSELRSLGRDLLGETVQKKFDFGALRHLIPAQDAESVETLGTVVETIDANPNVNYLTHVNVISLIELVGQFDQAKQDSLVSDLSLAVANIDDAEFRTAVEKLLNDMKTRNSLVGKTLTFPKDVSEGFPEKELYVVAFIPAEDPGISGWVEALDSVPISRDYVGFVVVCLEKTPMDEAILDPIKAVLSHSVIVSAPDNAEILKQCPITWAPFVVLVDDKYTVKQVNVGVDQVRNHVSRLLDFP